MKSIMHNSRSKDKLLHVETDLGIINIRVGLRDSDGRDVESIEFIPNRYAGETPVVLDGYSNTRFIRGGDEAQGKNTTIKDYMLEVLKHLDERYGVIIEDYDLLDDGLNSMGDFNLLKSIVKESRSRKEDQKEVKK